MCLDLRQLRILKAETVFCGHIWPLGTERVNVFIKRITTVLVLEVHVYVTIVTM